MGRVPCCEKDNVKRGQWTPEEDNRLSSYIAQHGTRNWRLIPKNAGLQRCGKSCRLRWTNYLRPDLKHGQFTDAEEETIVKLHGVVGNRWSVIAAQLPGRTDNDVKNYWNTKLKKKLSGMGIDPVTHKPFSHLMAEIATTFAPPQVAHLTEAALGCFKDEMLHLLTKKRVDFQPRLQESANNQDGKDETVEKIRLGLSRAIREPDQMMTSNRSWEMTTATRFGNAYSSYPTAMEDVGIRYGQSYSRNDGSPWNQTGQLKFEGTGEESEEGKDDGNGSSPFSSECAALWDLPSDELMNPLV